MYQQNTLFYLFQDLNKERNFVETKKRDMKTKFLTLCTLVFMSSSMNAQCINGTSSYPIYKTGAQLVETFDTEGHEIVRIEYDLLFTSKETFRNLCASGDQH